MTYPRTGAATRPLVEMIGATKLYGGVPAVQGVDLALYPGQVHGLLGENGAGKSTLSKSLAGVVQLTEGEILLEGMPVHAATPRDALELGIAMVFQESSLVPTTTVAQNLFLGQEKFFNNKKQLNLAAFRILQSLNFAVEPTAVVGTLSAAKKQMVEIARAVLHKAKLIIFDEPTTSLTPEEKLHFFKLMARLKAQGTSILFITHALEDALAHCDRITIMRDGKHIVTGSRSEFSIAAIIQAMIGRDVSGTMYGQSKDRYRAGGERILTVQNLRMSRPNQPAVRNNTFSISRGQVTGVFGLIGAGRTETFKIVAGIMRRNLKNGGRVIYKGGSKSYSSPERAVRDGIAYVTEDRKAEGFFETMDVPRNIYIGLLTKLAKKRKLTSRREERELGESWRKRLSIRSSTNNPRVVELSGGNQQKVVIARSLVQSPELIIFDEPTKGVDVGAIAEIHALINQLADEGKAVVVISSYLPEVMALSDRVLVTRSGKVVQEFAGSAVTQEAIMHAALY